MILRVRKHTVAWLGLMAMLLLVFVPLASQLIAAARNTDNAGPICSLHHSKLSRTSHPGAPERLEACAYCSFFDHHVSAPPVFITPQLLLNIVLAVAQPYLPSAHVLLTVYPSGRPRDPPAAF